MSFSLHLPACSHSFVGTWDARWRLAGLSLALLTIALLSTLPAAAAAFGLALTLAAAARLPLRWLCARLTVLSLLLLLFLVWLPFLHPGRKFYLAGLPLSWDGLQLAAILWLKALALVTIALTALVAAPLQVTCKAAHALFIPGWLIQLFLLTYRYLFVIAEEFRRLRTALRVRGFRSRANVHTYRTIGHVAGSLLVRSHDRAENVGQAMRCRGFTGTFHCLHEFHTRRADVALFLLCIAAAVALCVWDRLAMLGAPA